jgi:pyruvate dehydrogenase E2 component (dihydrolipoamide acetyltransferase)
VSVRDFALPDLGEGLEEGDIVAWHVEVGDVIELNQTVADVETAKAVVEVPSPFAGTIVERVGSVGETLEVGSVFLRIDTDVAGGAVAADAPEPTAEGEQSPAQGGFAAGDGEADATVPDADATPTEAVKSDRPSTGLDADTEPQPLVGYGNRGGAGRRRRRGGAAPGQPAGEDAGPARVLAKPPVRKLAKDLGVDLAAIAPGSGPDGVITRDDVHAAASGEPAAATATAAPPPPPAPAAATGASEVRAAPARGPAPSGGEKPVPGFRGRTPGEVEQVAGIRKRIIDKMEQSRREIPEALCSREADLTELWQLRHTLTDQARADGFEVKISPFALICRATVLALRRFPTVNARIDREAGEIALLEHINLGVAVDTDRGLIVPNIKDAHAKSTLQLALETVELAAKCRDGSATPGELTGGTFTVDNYGFFGNDDGNPIINHPEVGILGVGAIREKPWVHQGEVAVRRVARFTLAFDHRVCDGGEAGRFVTYVADLCEQPARLLLHV